METYIPSKDELQQAISEAVESAVMKRLPEIIRKATRKEHYTISEVCEMLDVSRRHLQYLRDSGQLTHVKNGRKVYFRAKDLEQFFDENLIDSENVGEQK